MQKEPEKGPILQSKSKEAVGENEFYHEKKAQEMEIRG